MTVNRLRIPFKPEAHKVELHFKNLKLFEASDDQRIRNERVICTNFGRIVFCVDHTCSRLDRRAPKVNIRNDKQLV